MDSFKLDAIKETWKKEIDYYLIMAITVDLKCYLPEIQEIIRTEFHNRGLGKVA
jgi:hypothetical protein